MKNFFKLLLSVVLCFTVVFGTVACGDETGSKNGSPIIEVAFHVDVKSKEGIAYKKRVDAFNLAHKAEGIKISPTFTARSAGATDYELSLRLDKTKGELADIITFDAPTCASFAKSKILYDITDLVDASVKNDFITLNEYNGRLYGLPIQESSAGFYYNKKIFRDAGVDVSAYTVENPWTFEQFKDVCNRIKSHCQTYAVDMQLKSTDSEMATYLLYPFIYASGGSFLSNDGLTATGHLDSQETQNGFSFIKELVTAGYTSYDINGTDFYSGKVGMFLSSGWTIPELDSRSYATFQSRDDWGLLPYPKGTTTASATGSWSYGVTDNGRADKTNVMKVLNWLCSVESAEVVTNATGMIPARKSVNKDYAVGSPEYILLNQLKTTGVARPATIAYPEFSNRFRRIIKEMGTGDLATVIDTQTSGLQSDINLKK